MEEIKQPLHEDKEAMERYWGPKLGFSWTRAAWLKFNLKMISHKEAKRVRRCKRNLHIARQGGYIGGIHENGALVQKAEA